MIKVAFCARKDLLTRKGGDSIQILMTKEYLEKEYEIEISIIDHPDQLDSSYQVAHIFNLSLIDETAHYLARAKSLKLKTALSPIYWDYSYAALSSYRSKLNFFEVNPALVAIELQLLRWCAALTSKPTLISSSLSRKFHDVLSGIDAILPNSTEELQKLADFVRDHDQLLARKSFVVANAATPAQPSAISEREFLAQYQLPPGYILQIGRIEFIKNQIQTVRALYDHRDMPIVFVGKPFEKRYAEAVKRLSEKRGNVYFIEEVHHSQVPLFYKFAKLHVLPSLRESPGLVSLEAMLAGCKIVVADERFAPNKTYFQDCAQVINPLSTKSLEAGIIAELQRKRDMTAIQKNVTEKFSWSVAAGQTYNAYQRILN